MKMFRPILNTVFPIIVIVGLWELIYYLEVFKNMNLFPPPSVFLAEARQDGFLIGIGSQATSIPASVFASVGRVLIGLTLGSVSALFVGFLLNSAGRFNMLIMPLISFMAPIAPIAWIPMALVVFGIGNTAAIFIVFMGVFFLLTIATVAALEKVPGRYINRALTKGATNRQIWLYVKIPYILPSVFTILRLNFIAAWMAVLAAEMVGLRDGLGGIFMTGRNLFNNELIMMGMFLIAITGFIFDQMLRGIQQRFFWWGSE